MLIFRKMDTTDHEFTLNFKCVRGHRTQELTSTLTSAVVLFVRTVSRERCAGVAETEWKREPQMELRVFPGGELDEVQLAARLGYEEKETR